MSMADRGPDGQGVWCDDSCTLGHRRLRVLDLRPVADQPLANEDGSVQVVFNGEIYNHNALRTELSASHRFRTDTDTEVLVHGYEAWGPAGLVQRLDGMFAFGLWDARRQQLVLARDRFGKKPLFYSALGGGVAFASTLNALMPLLPKRPALNAAALDDYFTWLSVIPPETVFANVWSLLPSSFMIVTCDGMDPHHPLAANVEPAVARPPLPAVLERVDALLSTAVRKRLAADVPLGAFLSGGIDSGLVVAKMAEHSQGSVLTVTVGFAGDPRDERAAARRVAERYGTDHHEEVVAEASTELLPDLLRRVGQPLADPSLLPTFAVARAARQHVVVALNGDGGDEFFAGYARPIVAKLCQRYARLVPSGLRRRLFSTQSSRWSRSAWGPLRQVGRTLEAGRLGVEGVMVCNRAVRSLRTQIYTPQFLGLLRAHDPDRHIHPFAQSASDWPQAVLEADVWTYLSPQLLTKMDVMTMAVGLEARSPLLDRDLTMYAATLSSAVRIPGYGTKYLLRRLAERYLPAESVWRHKTGFAPPVTRWFRGGLGAKLVERWQDSGAPLWNFIQRDVALTVLDRHQRGEDWGDLLWTLFCADIWMTECVADAAPWVREVFE